MQRAKATYEALNTQLLDELPKLYKLSTELLRACIARLVRAQRTYFQSCMEALCNMPDVSSNSFIISRITQSCVTSSNLMFPWFQDFLVMLSGDAFASAHEQIVERVSTLRFVTKAFNPNIDEKRPEQQVRMRKVSDINVSRLCRMTEPKFSPKLYLS